MIGHIGADPTTTDVGENRRVTNYTVATSETRPDKEGVQQQIINFLVTVYAHRVFILGNLVKRTQWHRVAYWQSGDWFSKVKKG